MFSDLECDFINPIDLCQRLNIFVIPEMAIQTILTGVFLLTGQWIAFLFNFPLALYHGFM